MERREAKVRRAIALMCLGAFVAAATACSGDGDETSPTASVDGAGTIASDDGELFTENPVDSVAVSVEPVVESIDPVADTGVPGIDSDDPFCRAWSEYAGSVQALALAWAVQPAQAAALLEVAASDAVSDAVDAMARELPSEIEADRAALTADVPGPFLRRAERARQALVSEGVSDAEIEQLGDAWIEALTAAGVDADDLSVTVPPDLAQQLEAAAGTFRDAMPSIIEDPTLDTTEFDISRSLDYIFETCPDRGTLAGNDVVEG